MRLAVHIRPYEPSDWPLVFSCWLNNAWRQHRYEVDCGVPAVAQGLFKEGIRARVQRLLRQGQCLVAETGDKNLIVGFVAWQCWVAEGQPLKAVHFIWTRGGKGGRAGFRRMGVASQLLERSGLGLGWCYTQHTAGMARVRRPWGITFNPFLVEG